MPDVMVRMAELAVSASLEDVLASIGLGSCVAVCLIDRRRQLGGLAHVMLPESPGGEAGATPAKFADSGVPALMAELGRLGALRPRLEAVLVGGAHMFARAGTLDIGARNVAAVRETLLRAGVRVSAQDTGGQAGRTVRLHVATGTVTVKAAGGREAPIWPRDRRAAA